MALDGVLCTEMNNRAALSAKQDQNAHIRSLILLYTLPNMNPCSQRAG